MSGTSTTARRGLSGTALALVSLFCLSAHADTVVLPAGTKIQFPKDPEPNAQIQVLVLADAHFLVERDTVNHALAAAEVNQKLATMLTDCEKEKAQKGGADESGFMQALRWGAMGAGALAIFAMGWELGSHR